VQAPLEGPSTGGACPHLPLRIRHHPHPAGSCVFTGKSPEMGARDACVASARRPGAM